MSNVMATDLGYAHRTNDQSHSDRMDQGTTPETVLAKAVLNARVAFRVSPELFIEHGGLDMIGKILNND